MESSNSSQLSNNFIQPEAAENINNPPGKHRKTKEKRKKSTVTGRDDEKTKSR